MGYTNSRQETSLLLRKKVSCRGKLWKVLKIYERKNAAEYRANELLNYDEGFDILVAECPGSKRGEIWYGILIRPSKRTQGKGTITWTHEDWSNVDGW